MRIGESEVSKAYLGPTLLYSKSPLIASYKCYDKTNEDSDRAVLEDLTGNGYDIQLNNFAFGGMSGYGGYSVNYKTFINHINDRYEGSMSSYSINVTRVNSLNSINFTVFTEYSNASIDIPEYKIKITGVTDSTYFVVDVVEPYSDPIQLLDVRSDGEYTVPAYIGSTDIVDEKIWYRYKIVDERLTVSDIDVNIKVELVPKYPGALVSDGIDDYGIYTNIPTFSRQNGYTIIAIRKWLDTSREGCLLTRNDHNSQSTEFRFETIGVMGDQYTSSYTSILGVSYPKLLSYQTSKSYGVSKFTLQDVELQATDAMLLFAKVKNRLNAKVALYALNIYNRDLTDKEIEAEKLKMIAEYEEKTGDYSYSLVAAWSAEGKTNEDKDRNILKDISDNGHDITLNNFAFAGMSGYNGYSHNFNLWQFGSQTTANSTKQSNKCVIRPDTSRFGYSFGLTNIANYPHMTEDPLVVDITADNVEDIVIYYILTDGNTQREVIQPIFLKPGTNRVEVRPLTQEELNDSVKNSVYFDLQSVPITEMIIELVPQYLNGLVFDGIDDYGVTQLPLLKNNDFTFICKRKIIDTDRQEIVAVMGNQSPSNGNDYMWFEYLNNATGSIKYDSVLINGTQRKVQIHKGDISFITPTSYNTQVIYSGNPDITNNSLCLGGFVNYSGLRPQMVCYSAYLFNRTLTDQEIKKFIRDNIDPQYLLPSEIPAPDVYYDLSEDINDDKGRDNRR